MFFCLSHSGSKIFSTFIGFLKSQDPTDGTEQALLDELTSFNEYLKENVSLFFHLLLLYLDQALMLPFFKQCAYYCIRLLIRGQTIWVDNESLKLLARCMMCRWGGFDIAIFIGYANCHDEDATLTVQSTLDVLVFSPHIEFCGRS